MAGHNDTITGLSLSPSGYYCLSNSMDNTGELSLPLPLSPSLSLSLSLPTFFISSIKLHTLPFRVLYIILVIYPPHNSMISLFVLAHDVDLCFPVECWAVRCLIIPPLWFETVTARSDWGLAGTYLLYVHSYTCNNYTCSSMVAWYETPKYIAYTWQYTLIPPRFRCCMQPYSVRVYSIGFPILFRMLSQDNSTRNIHTAIAIIKFIDVHNVMCLYFCYIIHAWSWRENPPPQHQQFYR